MDGEIGPEAVAEALADGRGESPRIVDVRSPAAFARGHIPGSENLPFASLPDRVSELAGAAHVVTVCPHGEASVQAARLIASFEGTADARVESMAGGLEAWDGDLEATPAADGGGGGAGAPADPDDAPF
jgi:rhodanese-related sulfurtransferase